MKVGGQSQECRSGLLGPSCLGSGPVPPEDLAPEMVFSVLVVMGSCETLAEAADTPFYLDVQEGRPGVPHPCSFLRDLQLP